MPDPDEPRISVAGLSLPNRSPMNRPLSRRTFFAGATAVVGATAGAFAATTVVLVSEERAAAAPKVPGPVGQTVSRAPVVGFHMDRPFLDLTGTAEPYLPAAGLRSGQALAGLSEAGFLSQHAYRF